MLWSETCAKASSVRVFADELLSSLNRSKTKNTATSSEARCSAATTYRSLDVTVTQLMCSCEGDDEFDVWTQQTDRQARKNWRTNYAFYTVAPKKLSHCTLSIFY